MTNFSVTCFVEALESQGAVFALDIRGFKQRRDGVLPQAEEWAEMLEVKWGRHRQGEVLPRGSQGG